MRGYQRYGDVFLRERDALGGANYKFLKNNKLCLVNRTLTLDTEDFVGWYGRLLQLG